MSRWTEDEYQAYRRRIGEAAAEGAIAAAVVRRVMPRAESQLEAELAGHLSVMGLQPEREYRFHPERRWRLDFAFVAELVAVELDGGIFAAENGTEAGRHARGMGRVKDYEKRNAAAELGWRVLCYGPPQVRSGEAAIQIERIVKARRAAS